MKTVHKSVLIWYSAEEMFALVTDVPSYPAFLPWCDHASVLSEDADGMTACVGIAFSGIKQGFTTRNKHIPGRRIHLQMVDGPFSKLEGHWEFNPVGADGQRACKVDLTLEYDFDNFALAALIGPVFGKIAGSLVDAFVKRAGQVYGEP
jgi:ribosome-associated toxin RatA of RatAB toxin-antitoxin module